MQLLERETYLAALDDYAADADSGNGRLVVISGEPGIGKTSLVDAFRESRPDLRWLWGACDGSFTPRPLGPLREIIDQLDGSLPEPASNDDDRHRLFAAFLADLEASPSTTGVVVEDLHWADEATLDWLGFLARRVERTRTLVVVTLREGEASADGPHRKALTHLVTHRSTRRVSLPPLSTQAVQRLADGTCPRCRLSSSSSPAATPSTSWRPSPVTRTPSPAPWPMSSRPACSASPRTRNSFSRPQPCWCSRPARRPWSRSVACRAR